VLDSLWAWVSLAGRGDRVDTTVQAVLRDTVGVAQGAGHTKPSRAGLTTHLNDLHQVVAKDVGAQAATTFKAAYAYAKVVAIKAFGAADDADAAELAHMAIGFSGRADETYSGRADETYSHIGRREPPR
jgi:hypothetical protein